MDAKQCMYVSPGNMLFLWRSVGKNPSQNDAFAQDTDTDVVGSTPKGMIANSPKMINLTASGKISHGIKIFNNMIT